MSGGVTAVPVGALRLRASLAGAVAILLALAGPAEGSLRPPSGEPAGAGTLAPAAVDDQVELVFQLVDDPDLARLEPDSRITAITEGDGVLVALAECGNAVDSPECLQVLRSTDGLDWEIVLGPLLGYPFGVAWTEDGFVMLFNDGRRARQVLYHSTDGRMWTDRTLSGPDYLEALAAAPDGYLGLGCDRSCERTVPWRSTDGRRWVRDSAYGSQLRLTDIATSADTLVGVAGATLSETVGAIALSEGRWVELDLPLPERADLAAVAALPDGGFAIAGSVSPKRGPLRPFLLTSGDGLVWDFEPGWLDLGLGRASIAPTDLAAGPGLLAMTMLAEGAGARAAGVGEAGVAWSPDGTDWRLATLPAPRGAEAYPDTLLVTREGRVVAAGTTEGRDREPAIWVGELTQGGVTPVTTGSPGGMGDTLPPGTILRFEREDDAAIRNMPASTLRFVAAGDDAIVAIGDCDDFACTMITRSEDGSRWEPVPGDLAGLPVGLAWWDGTFVVLATEGRRQVAYHSSDGGTWSRVTVGTLGPVPSLVAGPTGFLAFGCDGQACARSTVWWSPDGESWERRAPGAVQGSVLGAAATSGERLVAIGSPRSGDGPDEAFLFELGSWRPIPLPLPPVAPGEVLDLIDVAVLPGGGLAITGQVAQGGDGFPTDPFLLTSVDGLAWGLDEGALDAGTDDVWLTLRSAAGSDAAVATVEHLLGLAGDAEGLDTDVVAWSPDGTDWTRVELPAPRRQSPAADDMAFLADGRLIAVGATSGPRGTAPAIWTGTLDAPTGVVEVGDEVLTGTTQRERASQEQELLALAGYASCRPYRARGEFDPFEFGATAAVQCDAPEPGVEQVAVFRFPDGSSLEEWWAYRVGSITVPLPSSDPACLDGRPGQGAWEAGSVACYVTRTSPEAQVRWTDEGTGTYWLADASHRDLPRLSRWWTGYHP